MIKNWINIIKNGTYQDLDNKDIDYGTYNDNLAISEIDDIKQKIKDLFRFKYVYNYTEILDKIKKSFKMHQENLFENYYLDKFRRFNAKNRK